MTFALDATYSAGRNLSGVGVYCGRLLAGLAVAHPEANFLWCYRAHRLRLGLRQARPRNAKPRLLLDGWQPFRADLFHGLNQRMPASRFRRTVCTFHDLFVMTSEYSSPEFRARFTAQAREAAARADLLICVSEFTASQVESLLGVERGRLRVVHHGTTMGPLPGPEERQPLILHVGAIQVRKNLARLIGAFEEAAPPPWRLVLAGSDGYGAEQIRARIEASPARERIETPGWVAPEALEALYQQASVFAFPSLDEGFGIPVLEAMAHGVPVISSNRPALAEACGKAAVLVDPLDQESLADGLRRLVSNPSLREHLMAGGWHHAAQFSWERAVESTWRVYRELTG